MTISWFSQTVKSPAVNRMTYFILSACGDNNVLLTFQNAFEALPPIQDESEINCKDKRLRRVQTFVTIILGFSL
jgi:hypothetical protein